MSILWAEFNHKTNSFLFTHKQISFRVRGQSINVFPFQCWATVFKHQQVHNIIWLCNLPTLLLCIYLKLNKLCDKCTESYRKYTLFSNTFIIYLYIYIFTYIYTYIYTYTYIYIYIYTKYTIYLFISIIFSNIFKTNDTAVIVVSCWNDAQNLKNHQIWTIFAPNSQFILFFLS